MCRCIFTSIHVHTDFGRFLLLKELETRKGKRKLPMTKCRCLWIPITRALDFRPIWSVSRPPLMCRSRRPACHNRRPYRQASLKVDVIRNGTSSWQQMLRINLFDRGSTGPWAAGDSVDSVCDCVNGSDSMRRFARRLVIWRARDRPHMRAGWRAARGNAPLQMLLDV